MIPRIIPPLTGLTVLVTRPKPQAESLAESIQSLGGEAIVFPTIAIERCEALPNTTTTYDWAIFVSVHAVEFGSTLVQKDAGTRVAGIGKATAGALSQAGIEPGVVPGAPFTSEALLAHPDFQPNPGQRVLIVRGEGGRETLRETLQSRGVDVDVLEVYRRVKPCLHDSDVAALEARWADDDFGAVTATSVETFRNLHEILTPRGRDLLSRTPLVAPTRRILDSAVELGWSAAGLVANGADDAAIVGALAYWRARARDR